MGAQEHSRSRAVDMATGSQELLEVNSGLWKLMFWRAQPSKQVNTIYCITNALGES